MQVPLKYKLPMCDFSPKYISLHRIRGSFIACLLCATKEDYITLALDAIIESKIKAIVNKKSNKMWTSANSNKHELMLVLLH